MKTESLYLVAYYSLRPQRRVKTQLKGWMDQPDAVQYDEQVAITRRLKNADYSMAKVILDMTNKKVVRNGWGNTLSFDQFFEYFSKGYPEYTYQVMSNLDPEYLARITGPKPTHGVVTGVPTEVEVVDTAALATDPK